MIAIAALIVATQVAYVAFALTYQAERPASQGWDEPPTNLADLILGTPTTAKEQP